MRCLCCDYSVFCHVSPTPWCVPSPSLHCGVLVPPAGGLHPLKTPPVEGEVGPGGELEDSTDHGHTDKEAEDSLAVHLVLGRLLRVKLHLDGTKRVARREDVVS